MATRKKNGGRLGSRLSKQEAPTVQNPTVQDPAVEDPKAPAVDELPKNVIDTVKEKTQELAAPDVRRSVEGCTLVYFGDKTYLDRKQIFNTTAAKGIQIEFVDLEDAPYPVAYDVPANVARIILTNTNYMNFTGFEEHIKEQITVHKNTIVNNNLGIDATWKSAEIHVEKEVVPQHYEHEQRASNAPFNNGYYREDDEEPIMGQAGTANADGGFIGSLPIAQLSDNQDVENIFSGAFTEAQEIREREGN